MIEVYYCRTCKNYKLSWDEGCTGRAVSLAPQF